MKDVGVTISPLYSDHPDASGGTGARKPRRREPLPLGRDDLPLVPNDTSVTVASKSAAAAKRDVAADFRIVVAARIRPFTEAEVRQWRQERRAAAEELEGATAARNGGPRSSSRQPLGSEQRSLSATVLASASQAGATASTELAGVPPYGPQASLNVDSMPLPAVEVESDGRTIVLLDRHRLSANGSATAPVRSAFTYDYVYSSFTPRVMLDARLTGSLALPSASVQRASGGAPYIIADETEDGAPHRAWRSPPSMMPTPEQEGLAEAEQVAIYEQLAIPLVDAALQGYNTCMFAYGQTGSGKTYTMMGTARHPGLIPRLCQLLFARVAMRNAEAHEGSAAAPAARAAAVVLQISYMEIYNEQVRDLLKQRPKNAILRYRSRFDRKDVESDEYRTLKVRHHPSQGIYVEGLTCVPVSTWAECEELLQAGNALRTQCSTAMNANSSRSHAIFQFQVTQREGTGGRVRGREVALETFSKINLVDLAGSERNTQSKATGKHLAEANSINASLSTLRRVLDGLVNNCNRAGSERSTQALTGGGKGKKGAVIPYRESLLTYVLSDNLGGNSFTVMCANVSPGASNIGETESTLRYATLARGVVNHARLNEAPASRIIREMREQMQLMQEALRRAPNPIHVAELKEGILLSEQLLREMREREDKYELRLQSSEAQKEALRKAVARHQAAEAYWRAEAQRQQEELISVRTALGAMTAGRAAADAASHEGDAKAMSWASGPRRLSPLDTSLRLPWLSRGTEANGPTVSPALSFSAEHCSAGDTVGATWSPARAKEKKHSTEKHLSLAGSDSGGAPFTGAVATVGATDLRSPRLRETTHLSGAVPPHHRGGSSAGSPCTTHRESDPLPPAGAPQQQQHKAKRAPQKPQRLRSSHMAPSRRPRPTQNEGDAAEPPPTRVTAEGAAEVFFAAAGQTAASVQHDGGGGAAATNANLDDAPSFYQTVTYLGLGGGVMEESSSVSASSCTVLLQECGEGDKSLRGGHHRSGKQRPDPERLPRCSGVPQLQSDAVGVHQQQPQQSTRETLQQRHVGPAQRCGGGLDEKPEMERQASTPMSSRWPMNSPWIGAARQAEAARDCRRRSVTADSSPSQTAKAGHGMPYKHRKDHEMVSEVRRSSSFPQLLPPQQQANSGGANVGAAAKADVREYELLQPTGAPQAAAIRAEKEGDGEVQCMQAEHDVDLSRRYGGESSDEDGDRASGAANQFECLTDAMPADGASGHPGRYPHYPTAEAATEGAVVSAAADTTAPSLDHALLSSIGRNLKQNGRANTDTSGPTPSRDRHYFTVKSLNSPAYW
ncbi:hypothetical protein LSCM1_04873 [Leishmania martiniquensis]|uniref:Kinesin motor domain-containing protein n=1 Tax=Leishmania martiniquensis TaxID=1580590 RepID=A0A836HSC5_9TRYP|nr:hypothetical protein LSCM1_04873 [Leishmania martiniquensis]